MTYIGPDDATRWDYAIDLLNRAEGGAHVPLIEAARAGVMDLVFTNSRSSPLPFSRIRKSKRPVLILIGDDDDTPSGPSDWLVARQVTRWCRGGIVHGAGAKRCHYEMAVTGALACGRFLMVDTASRHVAAWMALLGHVQALAIVPIDGPHPAPMQAETMH